MSQYNNIKITPYVGVSSDPVIEFTGAGNSTLTLRVLDDAAGGITFEGPQGEILSLIDTDISIGSSVPYFSIQDFYGIPQIEAYSNNTLLLAPKIGYAVGIGTTNPTEKLDVVGNVKVSGLTTTQNLYVSGVSTFTNGPILVGSATSTGTASQPLQVTGGAYVSGSVGIGTTNPTEKLDIDGNALVEGNIIVGSSIGAASTEKMEISAVSRENGLLEIANYGGNQLFSVSNDQSETAFSIYRYANYEDLSITSFENRNLFSVSPLGIVTTYGALRVGTSITTADSSVYNELYGRLNVRAPFSTSTEYVSIVPKFNDKGALSFEAPVGTAQTDRGTQIFSISNNVDSSIFRVNDLNRNPIFEASASGNAGIGTTNPQTKLEVHGSLRITSAGSTANEQIDINHYRNVAYQPAIGVATDNKGAISFDSPAGISTDGNTYYPASLFSITNGGNVFTALGYDYWSGSPGEPGIDVTVDNKIGIGTASPKTSFEIKRDTTVTGDFQIQNRIIFDETINPGINSTANIRLEPLTPGITTYAPTRGSLLFNGALDQSLNGGQLLTVVNDNDSLLTVNRFAGLSTTNVTGTRSIETVFEVTSSGNVGIGTTNPTSKLDVRGDISLVGIETYTTTIQAITATADRYISFPDRTGVVALVQGINGSVLYNNAGYSAGGNLGYGNTTGTFGYIAGGGSATQATNKSTGIALTASCGRITMNGENLSPGTTATFTMTNGSISANDLLILNHVSGGTAGSYALNAQCSAGSANINVTNVGLTTLGEAIVVGFAVIKTTI